MWQRAVSNDLALTEESYRKALRRAKEVEIEVKEGKTGREREKQWFNAIRRDVGNTYPDLKIFQPGGPLNEGLMDVLMAYSMYRSDVGYSHGTHVSVQLLNNSRFTDASLQLIAALLILSLPTPAVTFLTLANTLNRPLPLAFIIHDPGAMQKSYTLTSNILAFKFPRLHHHLLETLQLREEELYEHMFQTLFTCGLEIDLASRLWDVFVFEGDTMCIRAAVAILGKLEGKLYGTRAEVLGVLRGRWDVGKEDEFMLAVRSAGKEDKRAAVGKT